MKKSFLLLFCAALSFAQPVRAEPPPAFDRAQRADGARVTPDRFLRSYDPLTIFFPADTGPKAGGAEDTPGKYVAVAPQPAGEWRWIGPRALQFRPAEAWKPLARLSVKLGAAETKLVALLPTPKSTNPAADAEPTPELTQISLTFSEPVDVAALKRLMTVELRPSPGVSPQGGQMLSASAFDIRPLERAERSSEQTYVLRFREPISDGRVAILRLKLSDEPGLDDENYELRVRTAPPFAVTETTCGHGWSDDKLAGVLRCQSNGDSPPAPESGEEEGGDVGTNYTPTNKRRLTLTFTTQPEALDILRAREALRVTPPVDDLAAEVDRQHLKVSAKFLTDTVYELSIAPGAMRDNRGRPLASAFSQRFAFTRDTPALQWDAGYGVVERLGPQLLPLRGRGYDRADIRIHAIDPLSRDFWPFPEHGVETVDSEAPPLPGNEPKRWSESANIEADAIRERVKFLGSPAVSRLVELPIRRNGIDAKFGLDLKEDFARVAGREQPGTYLVGLRTVDEDKRKWLRVQVTDLSLSAIEEPTRVRFAVTSLATAQPVSGAQIRIEGVKDDKFVTLANGTTDSSGFFSWSPGKRGDGELRRVVVSKGLDTLVIDPDSAPSEYSKEIWSKPEAQWLSWTSDADAPRAEKARTLCHVFSERPIYRPEEPAHIKGFVRSYRGGALTLTKNGGTLVVTGPGNQEWRIPVKLDAAGSFYHKFDAQTPATGDYAVKFEPDAPAKKAKAETASDSEETSETESADAGQELSCGQFSFKKEAYRLPTFEVVLNAPQTVALDGTFDVDLLARYFAGGLAAERPVKWRAAQFPHVFTPPRREGFLFSTDARFSGEGKFKSTAILERDQRTDAGGAARMTFDTTIEPTAQPRRYSIEATVTGDDGIEVRNVQNVIALPPFVLGVKTPRYVERPGAVTPEIIAVDGKGDAIAGLDMTLRLIRRNWISTLQASDFAQGAAKYVTQVQDETILERKVTSAKDAQKIELEAKEAGVYVVQLEAFDRLKRRQQVSVDFFVGGETPVTFARPPASSATVTTDKEKYAPGETATLIIQSPFQNARALAIVEQPGGVYDYSFVDIANGFGRYALPVKKEQTPKLAVHFLIMRGRLKDSAPQAAANFDQGKPVTIAATKWIEVTPVKNIVNVKLEHPGKARPGQEVEVTLRLSDDAGKPVAGEATFWMVDQAVLSLAKERPLDPLPDFIVARETKMAARDTRNMAFGVIPLEEIAGGDGGELQEWGAENNISVRKNFTPVPIYLPSVKVGPDGVAKIKVSLPDTLTVFKLRAKAVSGPDRFGAAGGEMLIRQELVAQPALPRFVRPGDSFDIGLVARVVEGPGGAGKTAIAAPELKLTGETSRKIEWTQNRPVRVDLRADVPASAKDSTKLSFRIDRDADRARDAVEIDLPVKPDREPTRKYEIVEIAPGETRTLASAGETARAKTFSREVIVAADPALVKLVAGLNALVEYPYGCTEQRLSVARAGLALKSFSPILAAAGLEDRVSGIVKSTAQQIEQSIDGDGLVAFWPRAQGNVSLTAWAYAFLAQAQRSGETIDKTLTDRLANILQLSLRSDYPRLLGGEEMRERVAALSALAEGGKLDESYVAEFARRADFLPNESVAEMAGAAARLPNVDQRIVASLIETMWSRVKFASRRGAQVYAGQAAESASPVILPSETRSLAEMLRAAALAAPSDPRAPVLREALLRLGEGDGWGATNANAAAIEALAEGWRRPVAPIGVAFRRGEGEAQIVTIDANNPVARHLSEDDAPLSISNNSNAPLIALVETRYVPAEAGAEAQAASEGFAITRQSWRVKSGAAPEKLEPTGGVLRVTQGDVVEETAEVVNPEDRTYVAISLPIAAGYEPLNPNIATAPAEAQPSSAPTLAPTWVSFGDDRVFYAYDSLPKGNYRFAFRLRAQTAGSYTQPPALVETMYKKGVRGASTGARVEIVK
ncbi:alpha-2-macroglobulin [Methylocystis sp. WRRC1]|uniref:Ig-like domain-containing alpha-2-macroglobulin family protein n=1 Tax=Methylocystis sp. WRRC1 TaxID=1732014 RepID=UPI001D1450DA|nr:Ig-like domain-containing alpha-2-macroglobulin family protein [Methylocystis sp. WRRC1]MCC3246831.1 alpha-2-macroglobulin [Methylocystis sp. WRRC1]